MGKLGHFRNQKYILPEKNIKIALKIYFSKTKIKINFISAKKIIFSIGTAQAPVAPHTKDQKGTLEKEDWKKK